MKALRKILAFSLAFALLSFGGTIIRSDGAQAYRQVLDEKKYSIAADRIIYEITENMSPQINTFEATVRFPANLADTVYGGAIFADMGFSDTQGFYVGGKKTVEVRWLSEKVQFTNVDLYTGEWVHLAVVHDPSAGTLSLYLNGNLVETKSVALGEIDVEDRRFFVGSDWYNWTADKSIFRGEIRQISLYSVPLTAAQVQEDASKPAEINGSSRVQLIANWNFTENWGVEKYIADTSGNDRTATRGTVDRFVEMEDKGTAVTGEYDYSIAIIPDIQAMTYRYSKNLNAQSEWLVANKEKYNILFTSYLGDLVESKYAKSDTDAAKSMVEWDFFTNALFMLDNKIPYIFVPGNHDYNDWSQASRDLTNFNTRLPYSKYSKTEYFGGAFEEGHMENCYFFFRYEDVEYLVFALEYTPRYNVFNWVDRIISEHPNSRVILTSHAVLIGANQFNEESRAAGEGSSDFAQGWELLKKHDNIFMMFGGHTPADYLFSKTLTGDKGNTVRAFLVDLQGAMLTSNMNTFLLIRVNESKKIMSFCYYSPTEDACFNEQNQFIFSFADEFNPAVGVADHE